MKIKNKLLLISGLSSMLIPTISASCTKHSNTENDPINRGGANVLPLVEDDLNSNESHNESSTIKESKTETENNKSQSDPLKENEKMLADSPDININSNKESHLLGVVPSEKNLEQPEENITKEDQKSLKIKIESLWKKHKYGFADFHTYNDVVEQLKVYVNDKTSKFLKLFDNKLSNDSIKKNNSRQIIDLLVGDEKVTLRFGDIKDSVPIIYALKGDESNTTVSYTKDPKNLKIADDKKVIIKQLGYFKDESSKFIRLLTAPENTIEVPEHLPLKVNSLSEAFAGIRAKEVKNLEKWNTTNVVSLLSTFSKASNFNQSLGNWNTSNVQNMSSIFFEASNFNKPLMNWDTRSATTMYSMFSGAQKFDQDISNWKTHNVTDMADMFWGASVFNSKLNNWDVSKVKSMDRMFSETDKFNQDIRNWKVEKVESMYGMFGSAKAFDQDLSSWKVSSSVNHQHFVNKDSKLQQKHIPPMFRATVLK
nr:BspA family leucine-rich repeat surface protein [Mycoplasmopsis agalactiae]